MPKPVSNILMFCTLTGLRADESFKSIELFHRDRINYLNDKLRILEHFKFPNIFIRRTKKAYVSLVNENILHVAEGMEHTSYNRLKICCKKNNLEMRMSYCRKIFATHLITNGIHPRNTSCLIFMEYEDCPLCAHLSKIVLGT